MQAAAGVRAISTPTPTRAKPLSPLAWQKPAPDWGHVAYVDFRHDDSINDADRPHPDGGVSFI